MTHHASRVLIAVIVCVCLASPAWAQRDMGTVLGTVTDASGAVVAGAKVTVTEDATQSSVSLTTDDSGNYIRPLLKPGVYTIEVELAGFKKSVQKNVQLNSGDRVQVNVILQVGEVTQAIEITSAPPALQTESAELGRTIQSQQVVNLPLGGQRKFSYLARTAPAVLPAEPGARDAAGGGFAANGVRSNGQNNFLLNGVDNNVNVIDFINQTAYVVGPSIEAIGEMKILTNGYNAEYGRGAGGVVNVTIKSGTNGIHGAVFEFLQNDALAANKWESNRAGVKKGPFKQNLFGAAVGGPIIKDRTFFFGDYQGTRITSTGGAVPGIGNTFTRTVPHPAFRNGDFSRLLTGNVLGTDVLGRPVMEGAIYDITTNRTVNGQLVRDAFPGNIIPSNRFDAAAKKLIDLYPDPNQNLNDRIPGNNFYALTSGTGEVNQWDIRIDHKLTDKDSLFGSLSWSNEDKFNTPPFPVLDGAGFAGEFEKNLGRNAMMSWTRVWSPTVITESRIAFSRLVTSRVQANADEDLQKAFGIGGLQTFTDLNGGLPTIVPEGYDGGAAPGGAEWLPTLEYSNVWDFIQNVSVNKGKHAYKMGFEYRPIGFPFFQVPSPRGTMRFQRNRTQHPQFPSGTGDGIAGWLLGYPGNSRITSANFVSSDKVSYAGYFQDDWKLSPKLTLNLGLRYELFSPIGESWGRQSTFDQDRLTLVIPKGPNQDAPLPPNFATAFPQIKVERGQVDSYMIPWDKTDWSPRIGIAWEVMDRSVIRAGYGIFYGGEENQGGNPNRGENAPFNFEQRLETGSGGDFALVPGLGRFSDGFPTNVFALPAAISFRTIAPNFRNPLVHKWNLAVQRELGYHTSLEVAYIGSKGQRLVNLNDPQQPVNAAAPGLPTGPRRRLTFLDQGTNTTNSNGFSRYHGLYGKLEKTFSNGMAFLGSYTWSHALTNVGTTLAGGPGTRDVLNWTQEYAHANFHIKHRFVYSTTAELPFGRGKKFGGSMNKAADLVVGGWQANGILTFSTGPAFNLTTREQSCSCGGTVRPDLVAGKDPNAAPSGGRTPDQWFDITAVTRPTAGTYGNLGNYSNYGPGTANLDFSLFKDFSITERYRIQFRAEFFNLTNTPQFRTDNIGNQQGASNFGRINETLPGTERHIQFALRFQF
jgi:hypothetical protein